MKRNAEISKLLDWKQRWNDVLAPTVVHQYLTQMHIVIIILINAADDAPRLS